MAQDNEGNKPQLSTEKLLQNLGKTSRIGLTNTITGLSNLDGTVLRMSGTNFTLSNQEDGDMVLKVPNVSLNFSNSTKRIFLGGNSNPSATTNAKFNIATGAQDNGLFIYNTGTGNYGLSIRTAVNTNDAIQVHGYYGVNVKMFSVKGSGEVNSGNILVTSPNATNAISVTTTGNPTVNFKVTNSGDLFCKNTIITGNTEIKGILRVKSASGQNEFRVDADGNVRAREIKVDLDPIPDYVFKPDYKLMTLSEVEQYVKTYNHLPNIKSEEEFKQGDGIDIGEMNMKLLEKVEELTLYVIDLQKQIEEIKNK